MTFIDVLVTYGMIILEFSVELYVFLCTVLCKLRRRSHFALRAVLFTAAFAAAGLPIAAFYTAFGATVWGRILVYSVLFGLATLFTYLCFDESYLTVLFCCGVAYAAQNLVYKLFLLVWTFGEDLKLYDSWGEYFGLWYRIIYYVFFAAAVCAVWFAFVRKITARLSVCEIDSKMLAVTVIVLAVTIILCSIEDIYFAELSVEREGRFTVGTYYVLRQAGNLFSIVCCIVTLLLASKSVVERELRREVEYLKYAVRQSEQQYEISKDTIELINIKCHDIKYKLSLEAQRGGVSPESAESLSESISIYDSKIETGGQRPTQRAAHRKELVLRTERHNAVVHGGRQNAGICASGRSVLHVRQYSGQCAGSGQVHRTARAAYNKPIRQGAR